MSDIRFYDPRDTETGFLSNFYRAPIQLDGFEWQTVEHYYQAQKFEDATYCERIRLAVTPREAKTLGQSRDMPVRADWESRRMTAMLQALVAKFTQNVDLQTKLLAFDADVIFVETSPQDHFWGDGADGQGENRLGYLLTTLRRHLGLVLANSGTENDTCKSPVELANMLFETVSRMHVSWWLTDSLVLETQTAVMPDHLWAYVRDVDLPEAYLKKYRVGLIFREPTFCDASDHSKQGFAAKHRYLLLSSNGKHIDALFDGKSGSPDTGLSIFPPNTLWKVLGVNSSGSHMQITLLEIPPVARHAFERQALSALEQTLANGAAERFASALQLPALEACKQSNWLERLKHPLGIRDDGVFLESWFNGQHEQADADAEAETEFESAGTESSSEDVESETESVTVEKPQKHRFKRAFGAFIMLLGTYIGFVLAQSDIRPGQMIFFAGVLVVFGAFVFWRPDSMN